MEWIKINRKLPPNLERVLLSNKKDKWVVAGMRHGRSYWNQFEYATTGDSRIYPTHWMPLPEPPKN